jgi:hypothetical protein
MGFARSAKTPHLAKTAQPDYEGRKNRKRVSLPAQKKMLCLTSSSTLITPTVQFMASMKARAESLGSTLQVSSPIGQGTMVSLVVPLGHGHRTFPWLSFQLMEEALSRIGLRLADAVLVGIGLPGMSGIEGIRLLKDDDERIFEALCAGASGYLLKRLHPRDCWNAV